MKTRYWIILLTAAFGLSLVLGLCLLQPHGGSTSAQIISEGKLLRTVSLGTDQTITVVTESGGRNVVTVSDGRIAVTQANCPDGYCMQRGWCSGGAQIVCLPNRLVIRFAGDQKLDGALG